MLGGDIYIRNVYGPAETYIAPVSKVRLMKTRNGYGPAETTIGICYSTVSANKRQGIKLKDIDTVAEKSKMLLLEFNHMNIRNVYGPAETSLWSSKNIIETNGSADSMQSIMNVLGSNPTKYIEKFNNTSVLYDNKLCIHSLFENQVRIHTNDIAVISSEEELTYEELNFRANQIANALIRKGVSIGDIIAFKLQRNSWLIPAILGILKSGALYLPLDIDIPYEREQMILQDSKPKFYITRDNFREFICDNTDNPDITMVSEALCYCIYTSGTTGLPKGVLIKHRNLSNFCNRNDVNNYQYEMIRTGKRLLSVFKSSFDAFGVDWALPLLNGKSLVLVEDEALTNARRLSELIHKNSVDIIHTTPSIIKILLQSQSFISQLNNIKVMMIAAEEFTEQLYEETRKYYAGKLFNGYGPTETTIGCSFGEI